MRIAILTTDTREAMPGCADPQPRLGIAPGDLLQGFAMVPEAEIHVVSCLKKPLPSVEKIAPNIFYHGVAVPRLGWLRTGYQGCIRGVRKKLREIQPDIVHGQGTERDCAISAALSGFPNVITVHGNMRMIAQLDRARPFTFLWLAARLERFTLPRTNGVVCISRYTQSAVASLARRTWLLPNAVDAGFFELHAAPPPDRPPVILCVGTICPRKNQNEFIRALDPLAAQKKIQVVFLGHTDASAYSAEYFQLVQARPWCEHINFAGRDRVKEHFKTASMLVLPTLEDNCPMVVLEAMAAGVPVLAANVGGVPELIESEKTGLFCDPQRPESFREGVERLLANREFAQRLAVAAKAEAVRRFYPQVIARQHLEIYRQVLAAER